MSISYFRVVAVWCARSPRASVPLLLPTATTRPAPSSVSPRTAPTPSVASCTRLPAHGENCFRPPQPVGKPWSSPRDATRFGASLHTDGLAGHRREGPASSASLEFDKLDRVVRGLPVRQRLTLSRGSRPSCARSGAPRHVLPLSLGSEADSQTTSRMRGRYFDVNHDVILVTANVRLGLFWFCGDGFTAPPRPDKLNGKLRHAGYSRRPTLGARISMPLGETLRRATIFGESSGGSSVAFHLTSLKSRVFSSRHSRITRGDSVQDMGRNEHQHRVCGQHSDCLWQQRMRIPAMEAAKTSGQQQLPQCSHCDSVPLRRRATFFSRSKASSR